MDEAAQSPLNDDEARLAVLENEISQAEASLEKDFASFAAEKIASDESLEEAFLRIKRSLLSRFCIYKTSF